MPRLYLGIYLASYSSGKDFLSSCMNYRQWVPSCCLIYQTTLTFSKKSHAQGQQVIGLQNETNYWKSIWALQTCPRSKVSCVFLSFQLLSLLTPAAAPLKASQALNPISTPALNNQRGTACVRSGMRKQLTYWNLRLAPSLPSWPWRLNITGEHLCASIEHILELPLAGNWEVGINTRKCTCPGIWKQI